MLDNCVLEEPTALVNLSNSALIDYALNHNEGSVTEKKHFVVAHPRTFQPKPALFTKSATAFSSHWQEAYNSMSKQNYFVSHQQLGADDDHALGVEIVSSAAWLSLAMKHLLFPVDSQRFNNMSENWTLMSAHCHRPRTPSVMINFAEKKILITGCNCAYTVLQALLKTYYYLLPATNILPLEASMRTFDNNNTYGMNFGLAHNQPYAWSDTGLFALTRGLISQHLPHTHSLSDTIQQGDLYISPKDTTAPQTVLNTNSPPAAIFFHIHCQLGIFPPIAQLSPQQGAYYFLLGYVDGFQFKPAYLQNKLPRSLTQCAKLFKDYLLVFDTPIYLVNTGTTGGSKCNKARHLGIDIYNLLVQATGHNWGQNKWRKKYPGFEFYIPETLPGIIDTALDPRESWQCADALLQTVDAGIKRIKETMACFALEDDILDAGPEMTTEFFGKFRRS